MKRFLKYDTEDAKNSVGPVDKNGVIKKDISGGGGVQPDWNQLEESEPDFIKNRPFGNFKGSILFSKEVLYPTLTDGAYVYTFSSPILINSIEGDLLVRVVMEINNEISNTKIYDNVPISIGSYISSGPVTGYEFTMGGEGYPFTINSNQIIIETDEYISCISKLEAFDMSGTRTKLIDYSLLDRTNILYNLGNVFPQVSNLKYASDEHILAYNGTRKLWECRNYLTIKSSSGKKFKLIVDDSGNLSTEEITS